MQVPTTRGTVVRFALFEADLDQRLLTKNGNRVKLQDQPFQILKLLLERPGELVTREEIHQKLWAADTFVEFDDGLNTAIKKLRTALGDTADNPHFIETIPRRGYRFVAPVTSASLAEPELLTIDPQDDLVIAAREQSRIVIETTTRPSSSPWKLGVAMLVVLAAVGGGYFYRATHKTRASDQSSSPASLAASIKMRPSVAVLGFRNVTERPDKAWLGVALGQMLSTELAEGEQLRMISGEQIARASRDTPWEPGETLAKDSLARLRTSLSTDYVTMGSYTVMGDGDKSVIRLDVRLQDAIGGETIGEDSVTGNEAELFDLVSKAGSQLRQRLGIERASGTDVAQLKASLPSNLEAARLYSEGLAKLRVFDALAARDLLQKAVAIDPLHALSHIALADSWKALGYDAKARDEAKKGFDLSTNLSREDRLSVEGQYRLMTHEYPRAIEIYHALNSFFPDNLEYTLLLARAQTKGGQAKDGLQTVAAMRNLPALESRDPRIDLAESFAAETLSDFKRSQQASAAAAEKANSMGSRQLATSAKLTEAWAWNRLGDPDKSFAAYSAAFELAKAGGNPRDAAAAMHGMGYAYYAKGDLTSSLRSFESALADFRKIGAQWDVASSAHNLGMVLTDLGRLQLAKQRLDEALRIQRELNDDRGVASDLDDISNILLDLGQLDAAVTMKQEALQLFRRIGNRMGEGITLTNLGEVLMAKGDLAGAKQVVDQSLAVKQEIGYKSGAAYALVDLARLSLVQDKLDEARTYAEQSLAIRSDLKDTNRIAEVQVTSAEILIEQGHPADAESRAVAAAATFEKAGNSSSAAIAQATVARALLAQSKTPAASVAADRAMTLSGKSEDLTVRFVARLASAEAQAANGKNQLAMKSFESIRQDAHRYGYVPYELEARLHQAEIQFHAGNKPAAHAISTELEKDASSHGFALIARKAADMASHTS